MFRNPSVWPRAFVAYNYVIVQDREQAIKATIDLATPDVAVLERQPAFPAHGAQDTTAEVANYESNRVVVRGHIKTPGMLVLLDSYGDGWTATVNGQAASIVPVNAAFRGVEVPAGEWEVVMQYDVPHLTESAAVTVVCLVFAVGALFIRRPLSRSGAERSGVDDGETRGRIPPLRESPDSAAQPEAARPARRLLV